MGKLMDIYQNVQSPIEDLGNLKRIIQIYSNSAKEGYNFYSELVQTTEKKYANQYIQENSDALMSGIFNIWKNNIINMTLDEYKIFYDGKGNFSDRDFCALKKYLSTIDDVKTSEEVENIMQIGHNNTELDNAIKKYTFEVKQGSLFDKWNYIDSKKLVQRATTPIQHRLYLNIERPYIELVLAPFLVEVDKRNLEYTIKYSDVGARDDTIVIYANNDNLQQYIEILREFREKYPAFNKVERPPIMAGKIDGWIGYGSEPTATINGKQQSYTTFREKIMQESISKTSLEWILEHKDMEVMYQSDYMKFYEYFSWQITDKFIEKAKKQIEYSNKSGIEPKEVEDEDFKRNIFNYINKCMDIVIQDLIDKNNIQEQVISINIGTDSKVSYTKEEVKKLIDIMAYEIAQYDDKFVENVRDEIKVQSKKYGIDENNFSFDAITVKQMQKADIRTNIDYKDTTNLNSSIIQPESRKYESQSIEKDEISKEQQEIEEILKKVINLTPENRKKAFQVLEILEKGQEKKER